MIGINEYKKAQEELNKIQEEDQKQNKIFDAEKDANYNKFYDLESELSKKKRIAENKLEKKREIYRTKLQDKEKTHVEKIQAYKRTLTLMEVSKDQRDTNFKVYTFDYPRDEKGEVIHVQRGNCLEYPDRIEIPYTPIDTIKDDKYAKIQIFITDNGKPKNKFSLSVAGHTIFPEKIIKPPYDCGYDFRTDHTNIIMTMADRPTKEELKAYYERNGKGILKQFLAEHKEVEQEYENIIANTDNKQWKIAYWNNKKDYYENHYSHGTETEEYKKVLQKIRELL